LGVTTEKRITGDRRKGGSGKEKREEYRPTSKEKGDTSGRTIFVLKEGEGEPLFFKKKGGGRGKMAEEEDQN